MGTFFSIKTFCEKVFGKERQNSYMIPNLYLVREFWKMNVRSNTFSVSEFRINIWQLAIRQVAIRQLLKRIVRDKHERPGDQQWAILWGLSISNFCFTFWHFYVLITLTHPLDTEMELFGINVHLFFFSSSTLPSIMDSQLVSAWTG